MQPFTTLPISFFISLSVLTGWCVHDTQIDNVVAVVANDITSHSMYSIFEGTTPNIETNWFSSNSSLSSEQPAAQTRNDDDEKFIAQGRVLGDSVGSDSDDDNSII